MLLEEVPSFFIQFYGHEPVLRAGIILCMDNIYQQHFPAIIYGKLIKPKMYARTRVAFAVEGRQNNAVINVNVLIIFTRS